MAQVTIRYGRPLSEVDQKGEDGKVPLVFLTFQKSGFEIEVALSDGISATESFRKLNDEPMTVSECRTLLTDNSQGYGWEAPQVIEEQKKWVRDDGAMAVLTGGRIFRVTSKDLLTKEATAKKLELQPSLEGF